MNQVDQNINKDMVDSDLIDVESLDFSDDQTCFYVLPNDSGQAVDIIDWILSCDWPITEDDDYLKTESDMYSLLDNILKNQSLPDKQKFDSRTYRKPKKCVQRPSIQNIVEATSNPPSMTHNASLNQATNKYLTYNKYNMPLGPISPMLRLKTFNVDTNTENSSIVKHYALKRRSLVQDDDPQLEDVDVTLSAASERLAMEHAPTKPINIDLTQPAHNLHNTFNRGLNILSERGSMNMYQSGESLMRMSPPSLVSSLLMESSGTFNVESLDGRKSMPSHKDSGLPSSGRESLNPMMTSMTLSILDVKDMSTSFLSQTTYPDNDSLMDSLPPSLVSSVNSSYVVSNSSKPKESTDSNIFSSATFTHLDQTEKLLSGRPRCTPYNSFTKRESGIKNSESYTKSREEASQIDPMKVLNENCDKKDSLKPNPEMDETITLHFSNNKFRRDEKENLNSTFEKDDAFYKDMGMQKTVDIGKTSFNVTMDKQELNEIIQARQKLSLARKSLPSESERALPNQVDTSSVKTIQLPNQTITVPKQSMENASELLSRRRAMHVNNGYERNEQPNRETPKRNATFKKVSPKANAMDTTVVYVNADGNLPNQMIDINSATLNLIDTGDTTLQHADWGSQERAMVGSSESTDTGTFSSSSPPESVPDTGAGRHEPRAQIESTPLASVRKGSRNDLMNVHTTISPIYNMVDDKSYTVVPKASADISGMERTYDVHNATVINSGTIVKKTSAKRDILAAKMNPDRRMSENGPMVPQKLPLNRISPTSASSHGYTMAPPAVTALRKTNLPMSKLRQYSSHKELNRIPASGAAVPVPRASVGRTMVRRGVYASNPALSPTTPAPPIRRDSYIVTMDAQEDEKKEAPESRPALVAPPALVRQGTETLRRDRPQSQLVAPRDLRASGVIASGVPVSMRNHQIPPPTTRPYSIAGVSQLRVTRPTSVPTQRPVPAPAVSEMARPSTGAEARASALPRPSRLPGPRRTLRPPSIYSVAPTSDMDHY